MVTRANVGLAHRVCVRRKQLGVAKRASAEIRVSVEQVNAR